MRLWRDLAAILGASLAGCSLAHAQTAKVIETCGTAPYALPLGLQQSVFMDQDGNLCVSSSGGGGGGSVTQGTTPWVVSGTVAATQSGTWTVQPGNTANTTAWKVDGSAVTQPISAAALPLPSGAATSANQTTWQGATGSAPPANAVYLGGNGSGATGGQLRGLITCDSHAKYDASDNGSKTLVSGVSGRKVYVCGYILGTGGTATNLKLREGSDADCASNAADLTPAWQLAANSTTGLMGSFWAGIVVSTNAYYVCVNASAGNAHQAELLYTIL